MRIDSKNNPAVSPHWIVADYDGRIDQHARDTVLDHCVDFRPQYICKTISGGARLLWRLEAPFLLHSNDLTRANQPAKPVVSPVVGPCKVEIKNSTFCKVL